MSLTRRDLTRLLGAGLASYAASGTALAQNQGTLPNLPGEYGRRLRSAQIKGIHLHNQAADGPLHHTLVELWDRVFERTGGTLLMTPLPNDANLLYADADAVVRVADGAFHLVSAAAPIIDGLVPDVGLQSLPYVYSSTADVLSVVNTTAFTDVMERGLAATNLVYLPGGTFSNGMRVTTTRKERPLRTLKDFEGLRVRIPLSEDVNAVMVALKAVPTKMPINQVHDAIKAGTVDAQENPATMIQAYKLYDVVHWINLTYHLWSGFNTLANRAFWTGLPDNVRKVVLEELPHYQAVQVDRQEKNNTRLISTLQANQGMEVMATDTAGAHQLLAPLYRSMYEKFSPAARALAEPLIGASLKP